MDALRSLPANSTLFGRGGEVTLTVGSEIFVPFSAYKKLITDFWDRGKSPPLSAKLYKLDVNRVNLVEFYMFAT